MYLIAKIRLGFKCLPFLAYYALSGDVAPLGYHEVRSAETGRGWSEINIKLASTAATDAIFNTAFFINRLLIWQKKPAEPAAFSRMPRLCIPTRGVELQYLESKGMLFGRIMI